MVLKRFYFLVYLGVSLGISTWGEATRPKQEENPQECLQRGQRAYQANRYTEAATYYIRAAEQNNEAAISFLRSLDLSFPERTPFEDKVKALKKAWLIEKRVANADAGYCLYCEGKYVEAAPFLRRASKGNHPLAQELYANICFRQLDKKPHRLEEAAMWYLLSAHGENPQAVSYLHSIIPTSLQSTDYKEQMQHIVGVWVAHATSGALPSLKPAQVNDYLIKGRGRKINKTLSQKFPYFFDKVATAILLALGIPSPSVPTDQPASSSQTASSNSVRRCADEYSFPLPKFIDPAFVPYSHGCFSPTYFENLQTHREAGYGSDEFLDAPQSVPKLSPVYRLLLNALDKKTSNLTAKKASDLSHREYPWLLAGIKFWEEKHKVQFSATSLARTELLRRLEGMNEGPPGDIPPSDIDSILAKIELPDIWPNDKNHPISKAYDPHVHRFFRTPLSTQSNFVQDVQAQFLEDIRSLTIDCQNDEDLEVLRTPLLMYYCRELHLTNVPSTQKAKNALAEAYRYFVFLTEIHVSYNPPLKESLNKAAQDIQTLLRKAEKTGIVVKKE